MAKHQELSRRLQINVYFADPHSSWQRGTNENINGLIRPCAVLNFQNPLEVYSQMIEKIQNAQAVSPCCT